MTIITMQNRWRNEWFVGVIIVMAAFLTGHQDVYASSLTYANATNISLTSPVATLTIDTTSVAVALVVNATSVAVTLSETTGGNFVILSPSYDLSVATSSSGGSGVISCSGGIESATLPRQSTGSTVYTVAPTTSNCASASPPVITSITAGSITTNNAIITWTTNVAADSTVSYGTTISYGRLPLIRPS